MKKLIRLLVLFSLSFQSSGIYFSKSWDSDIITSANIKKELIDKYNFDGNVFSSLKFVNQPDQELIDEMGLESWESQELLKWMNDRIQYIVAPEDIELIAEYPASVSSFTLNLEESEKVYNNLVGLYEYFSDLGPFTGFLFQVTTSEDSKIFLTQTSIQQGIVLVNQEKIYQLEKKNQHYVHESFYRIGNLFHEARHSDTGPEKQFAHVECPSDHQFAGLKACESNPFGAFRIEAEILTSSLMACKNCKRWDEIRLRTRIIDAHSRNLSPSRVSKEELKQQFSEMMERNGK